MSKKILNVQLRRLVCAVLIFAFTIFLSGCSGKEIVGSLDMNQEYASIGDVSITNGEVWDKLKWSAHEYLTTVIEKGVVSSYIDEVETVMADSTNEKYDEYCDIIKEYTVTSILSLSEKTTDVSNSVESLTEKQRKQLIAKYVDNMYLTKNVSLNAENIYNQLNELITDPESNSLSYLYKYEYESMAKYLLACHKLELDIKEAYKDIDTDDEDDIGYFTKANYTSKFQDKYVNQGNVETLTLRFMNSDEANDTMKAFGIKVYRNVWYYIQSEASMSYDAYEKYYDDFDISSTSNATKCERIDSIYGESAIVLLYISMYNYIYTYREALPTMGLTFGNTDTKDRRTATEAILEYVENNNVSVDDILASLKETTAYDDYIHYTAEELNDINSSLKTYVYTTLNLEDGDDYNRYSTTSSMYGSYYYMCFKFSHEKDKYDELYDEDDTTAELYEKITNDEELYNAITKLLFDETVSETFVNTTLSTLVSENIKVKVYDKNIEIAYAAANSSYSKNHSKSKSNNVLAQVTYTDLDENKHVYYMTLTADNTLDGLSYSAWDELELTDGATTAIDALSEKIIKKTPAYNEEISKEDYADYERSLELMLAAFANDSYSSSGYPASIGKYNFLMLYFHTADVDTIIKDFFHLSEVSNKLLTNYESEVLLNFFSDYSIETYNNYFSMTGTQIQVFLDIDEDGKPDPYSNWTQELKDAAKELLDTIVNIVEASTDAHSAALTTVIEEYTASSRFDNGLCTPGSGENYNPTEPECYWAKFRKLGLYVSSSEVSVTNSTTTDVDAEVKARLLDIYKNIPSYILGGTFPSQYLDSNIDTDTINYDYQTEGGYLVTEDGLNLLLATSGEVAASAKFTVDDDLLGVYTNIPLVYNEKVIGTLDNVYNDNDELTLNQIKLYLYETLADSATTLTPSSITSALDTFFKPVLTRFQASETQRVIILYVSYQLQNVDTIVFKGDRAEINQARFQETLLINERITDDYIDYLGDITETSNNYKNWWENIKNIVPQIVGEGSQN